MGSSVLRWYLFSIPLHMVGWITHSPLIINMWHLIDHLYISLLPSLKALLARLFSSLSSFLPVDILQFSAQGLPADDEVKTSASPLLRLRQLFPG
jgi:hypothetical protein